MKRLHLGVFALLLSMFITVLGACGLAQTEQSDSPNSSPMESSLFSEQASSFEEVISESEESFSTESEESELEESVESSKTGEIELPEDKFN